MVLKITHTTLRMILETNEELLITVNFYCTKFVLSQSLRTMDKPTKMMRQDLTDTSHYTKVLCSVPTYSCQLRKEGAAAKHLKN